MGAKANLAILTVILTCYIPAIPAHAGEEAKVISLSEMHALDLGRLKRLLKDNQVLEVATDMEDTNPNHERGEAFCQAQVKALREGDPSLHIPKPKHVFRGENGTNRLVASVFDASFPEGKLDRVCKLQIDFLKKEAKDPRVALEYELYRYPGSAKYNAVIYERKVESHAVVRMGFITYYPRDKGCSGLKGYSYHVSMEGMYDLIRGISDLYSWHGEDVFYTTVTTELNPHIRVLLYQPQYFGTPHGWRVDQDYADMNVDDPRYADGFGYQCRIEVSMPASYTNKPD